MTDENELRSEHDRAQSVSYPAELARRKTGQSRHEASEPERDDERNNFKVNTDKEDMPRERLQRLGADKVETRELIAILIGTGTRGTNVMELAQKILDRYGNNMHRLHTATPRELEEGFVGLGAAKAVTLLAAIELGRRCAMAKLQDKPLLNSEDAYRYFAAHIGAPDTEEFHVAVLDNRNNVVHHERVSEGGYGTTSVDLRKLFRTVLSHGGTRFMVAHNHPGGALNPSPQDVSLTNQIVNGAKTLDIKLLDHIIVARGNNAGNYYSFRANNQIA